jgi:hypothetical protein
MDGQQLATTREVNIGLNPAVSQIYGILEGFKCVFVRDLVATSVCYCEWK